MNSDLIPRSSEACIWEGLRFSLISLSSVSILTWGEKQSDSVLNGWYILLEEEYFFFICSDSAHFSFHFRIIIL